MPYTSLQNLIDRFGIHMLVGLTDRADVPTGQVDAAVVARALSDTDALIDGYLASRYALPLTGTPPLIEALASDIAIYKLHNGAVDPKVEEDHKAAVRSLQAIAAGTIRLPGASGIETPGTGGTGARLTDRERPMSESTLKGFI